MSTTPTVRRLAWSEGTSLPCEGDQAMASQAGRAAPLIYTYDVTLQRLVAVADDGEEEWEEEPGAADGFEAFAGVMGDDGEWVLTPHGEDPEDSTPYTAAEDRLLARLGLTRADLTDETSEPW